MAYTVVQCSLTPPTLEQLELAFDLVPGLTRFDAARAAKRAFGVLFDEMTEERAAALSAALHDCGVPARSIDEDELRVFEPTRRVPRAEFNAPQLLLYDALGRPTNIEWSRVRLVAVG